jgi:cardiolipin synthase A/B
MLIVSGLPLLGILVLTCHVLGVVAAGHAILHTRTSQGAVAWAVSLVAMPYLTLIPYLFLGRRRFEGYVDKRRIGNQRMRSSVSNLDTGSASADLAKPAELIGQRATRALVGLAGSPFVAGNRVGLLIDGDATFHAIFAALENAQHYAILQFFIVRDDTLGRRLSDLLISKAQQGVKIYFLYDGIGCHDLPGKYIATLRAAGIEMHAFATTRFINRFQLNFRNHRKIVVVDARVAFVGGLNVGDDYMGMHPPLAPWRDTHIRVEGPAVGLIQFSFIEDWYWATQEMLRVDAPQPVVGSEMHCQVIASGPADAQETCSLFFVEAINSAKERLWMTTPYFVPDEAVFAALRLAVLRGVDVRILMPGRADHYVVYKASMLYAYNAAQAGIQIYRYRPGFMHQKVVLIDDIAASVGSANLDNRSFRLNFEITVLTVDRRFAREVETMLTRDFSNARRIEPDEYRRTSALNRIKMHVARLFAPIL